MRKLIIVFVLLILACPVEATAFNDSVFTLNYSRNLSSANTVSNNLSNNLSNSISLSASSNSDSDNNFSVNDAGAHMVAVGINEALTKMGDDVYKQYGQERGFIFSFVTWNIKPEQIPIINQFYQKNLKLAFPLAFLFILGTVISRSIAVSDPATFTNVFGRKDFAQSDVVGGGLFLLIGLAFGFVFFGFMAIIDLINSYIMVSVMDSIAPSISNGWLYFFMAFIEMLLSVFFIYRQMWIVAGYALSPIYGLMYASGYLKEFIDTVGDKFIRAIIMQPMCILATVVWIIVMKAIAISPFGMHWDATNSGISEIALFLILLGICLWCTLGKMTFLRRLISYRTIAKVL
jgi:hypothetical protein